MGFQFAVNIPVRSSVNDKQKKMEKKKKKKEMKQVDWNCLSKEVDTKK